MVVVLLRSGSEYMQQITWQLIDSKGKIFFKPNNREYLNL